MKNLILHNTIYREQVERRRCHGDLEQPGGARDIHPEVAGGGRPTYLGEPPPQEVSQHCLRQGKSGLRNSFAVLVGQIVFPMVDKEDETAGSASKY